MVTLLTAPIRGQSAEVASAERLVYTCAWAAAGGCLLRRLWLALAG
jgi:hypothetical protein